MKTKIILSSLALATLFIFSCNNEIKKEKVETEQPITPHDSVAPTKPLAPLVYSCPMHPEIKSDKPGQCPECGMDLEAVEKTDSVSSTK